MTSTLQKLQHLTLSSPLEHIITVSKVMVVNLKKEWKRVHVKKAS
ncbi:hypothetical protein BTTAP_30101 [Brochothrix thermosphacta]|nr:hypothetical protein BTH160X_40077 [Brochothrix thermosphacta]SPP29227.1 hypothetical protein BTTAP_30101 [Brochothrix thermosphacta]